MQRPWGDHANCGGVIAEGLLVVWARVGESEPRPVIREKTRVGWANTELREPGAPVAPAQGGVVSQPAEAGGDIGILYTVVPTRKDKAVACRVGDITDITQALGGQVAPQVRELGNEVDLRAARRTRQRRQDGGHGLQRQVM